jgi:hypothetical protein
MRRRKFGGKKKLIKCRQLWVREHKMFTSQAQFPIRKSLCELLLLV